MTGVEYGVTCGFVRFCDRPRGHDGEHGMWVASTINALRGSMEALLYELWECAADFYENGNGADPEARYAAQLLEDYAPGYKPSRGTDGVHRLVRAPLDGGDQNPPVSSTEAAKS